MEIWNSHILAMIQIKQEVSDRVHACSEVFSCSVFKYFSY